jgi:RHS repeat-associated protein
MTLPGSSGTVTFKYDPMGRRIEKISPTATSIFAYDGNGLVETVNSSGGVVARYAQEGENIDEPLAMQGGTTTSYYEQDDLSSVTSLSSSTGTLAQTYTYDSFGNTTGSSGSLTNFLRYTGREFDTETGLYFDRARYLDPTTGRFISEDPLQFGAGENFYPYAFNSPVNLNDPYGLCPPPCPCGCTKCHIVNMLVTGYDNSYQSTQKNPGDPGYGITKSGKKAGPGTIAAPKNYPMGTGMFVPGYGCGTVQDRGGAIKNSHIDVWFSSTQQALNWGLKRNVPVEVCDDPH